MQQPILKIEHLSHKYSTAWAIRDINMEIGRNGIVGLLGSNGAGKSTTMNIMCGVLNQTEGRVLIDGIDIREQPELAKKQIGFLPQDAPLYLDLTVDEYLLYTADLRRMEKNKIKPALEEAKARCGIAHFSRRLIKNLSGGYRQRVGIAQAIIHKPKLVILDEPTNGLDPNQILEVRSLIRDIAKEHAVIFSSHILTEVQVLCKEIKMIEEGRIVFSDTMDAFNNYVAPNSILLRMENPPPESSFLEIPGISRVELLTERQIRLYFTGGEEIAGQLIEASVQNGWQLREIGFDKTALDEIFKQLSAKSTASN
ncbi:MAG TPA: ABC transporter ATP-binding protein [Chitinophaga sp.]